MMKRHKFILTICILLLATGCAAKEEIDQFGKDETIVLKFAHEEPENSIQDLYVKNFAELIKEKTGGEVEVEIFTIGKFGENTNLLNELRLGNLDMAITSPGTTGTIIPEAQFFNLHFLFSENMEVNKEILKSSKAINEVLSKSYEEKGIKTISFWTEGFMNWTSNRKLEKIDDFSDFKMRVMNSPIIEASYLQYGANPVVLPYTKVFRSLQLGEIDGQENPMNFIEITDVHKVQKYVMKSKHAIYVTATAVNLDRFNGFSKELQKLIKEAAFEATDYSYGLLSELDDAAVEKISEEGSTVFIELEDVNREKFKEVSNSVKDIYVDQVGGRAQDIINLLGLEIEKAEEAYKSKNEHR